MSLTLYNRGCYRKVCLIYCFVLVLILIMLSKNGVQLLNYRFLLQGHMKLWRGVPEVEVPSASTGQRENGYVIASSYSDQITGASFNILSLQCWAATVSHHIRVVEPFIIEESKLGINLTRSITVSGPFKIGENDVLRLRDIVDINSWNLQTAKYVPLVSWKAFLDSAPQDLIVVSSGCKITSEGCKQYHHSFYTLASKLAKYYNFRIVRYVQIVMAHYTAFEFRNVVYGNFTPSYTVVLFNLWGGIVHDQGKIQDYRIGITDVQCSRTSFLSFVFQPSEIIRQDSQRFIEQYMPTSIGKGYISVMFRSQIFATIHFKDINSTDVKMAMLTKCVNSISKHVNLLKKKLGIESVFLSVDCQKHGSNAFRQPIGLWFLSKDSLKGAASLLYMKLFGGTSSLDELDDAFDEVATFSSAGYVAQLQKHLAARGTCLVMAGGGGFQMSATNWYYEAHKSSGIRCAVEIPECS